MDVIGASVLEVVRAEAGDESRTIEILRQYRDKDFSYVDALSFAIMARLGIHHAFAFDRHFEQYGLAVLTTESFSS